MSRLEQPQRLLGATTIAGLAITGAAATVAADEVDFAKYLQSDHSAAALATALAMLGTCDTPVRWSESVEESALFVSCTDLVDGEEFDHGVRIDFVPDGTYTPMTFTAVP